MRRLRNRGLALARWSGRHLGARLLRLWSTTLTYDIHGWEEVAAAREKGPIIIVFWHSRFLMLPFIYPKDRPVAILISPSIDGDVIASVVEALGRSVVRGSSRRGGTEGRKALEQCLRRGTDVAIAVDGPTGPPYVVKSGAVRLAQSGGAPVVPLVYGTKAGKSLPSWDRFWLPGPFTEARFVWGRPQFIDPQQDVEVARRQLQNDLRDLLVDIELWAGRPAPTFDSPN